MDNLLDTHTFIWFVNGEDALSDKARKEVEKPRVKNYVSIASLWEIAIKISIGKLELKGEFRNIYSLINLNSFYILPVSFEDTLTVSALPFYHRVPFDRIIAAQAVNNELQLISKDKIFSDYGVSTLW